MNSLRKFIVSIFGICLQILVIVLVMMKGWGLEPQSWFWIIFVYFFGALTSQMIIQIGISS